MTQARWRRVSVALGCLLAAASPARSTPIIIDFEADAVGAKVNPFVPTGVGGVMFSDSVGQDLWVDDFGSAGSGHRCLYVGTDMDLSVLKIAFGFMADQFSLDFGNDDPAFTNPGDLAVLRLFHDAAPIGLVAVVLNRNDIMDQTISFGAIGGSARFNNVTFAYVNPFLDPATGGGQVNVGLAEVVDNLSIDPAASASVPEPGALGLLATGLVAAASLSRRRRRG